MKIIRCIIVDDEPLARELLRTYLGKLRNWTIAGVCKSAAETYEILYQDEIDIMFLDIDMPVVSGIEFLHSLKKPPKIIFTTAHAHYASQAFDQGAVDYLLKPITEERFLRAVTKLENLFSLPSSETSAGITANYVFIKQDTRLIKVMLADILYVEALKDFTKFYLKDKTMLVSSHLKMAGKLLPDHPFTRVHRSYIINLDAVTAIQGNTIEIGKSIIPIGGLYKDELMAKLNL